MDQSSALAFNAKITKGPQLVRERYAMIVENYISATWVSSFGRLQNTYAKVTEVSFVLLFPGLLIYYARERDR